MSKLFPLIRYFSITEANLLGISYTIKLKSVLKSYFFIRIDEIIMRVVEAGLLDKFYMVSLNLNQPKIN